MATKSGLSASSIRAGILVALIAAGGYMLYEWDTSSQSSGQGASSTPPTPPGQPPPTTPVVQPAPPVPPSYTPVTPPAPSGGAPGGQPISPQPIMYTEDMVVYQANRTQGILKSLSPAKSHPSLKSEIEALEVRATQAETERSNGNLAAAHDQYKAIGNDAEKFKLKSNAMESALSARKAADAARDIAAEAKAEANASVLWEEAYQTYAGASAQFENGSFDEATAGYKKSTQLFDDAFKSVTPLEIERLLRIARENMDEDGVAVARDALEKVLELDPNHVDAKALYRKSDDFLFYTNSVGMRFASIPTGLFMMGTPSGDRGWSRDEWQHPVQIKRPFKMQTTEVTQEQFEAVMGFNPSLNQTSKLQPVENVTLNTATAFCEKLSLLDGKAYRLPTEAEWEYACRAGTSGPFSGELDKIAWYEENSGGRGAASTQEVARKLPNPWGLYDMHGNVTEWCIDAPRRYEDISEPLEDPVGPIKNQRNAALRGGDFLDSPDHCRAAHRMSLPRDGVWPQVGFRVVLEE